MCAATLAVEKKTSLLSGGIISKHLFMLKTLKNNQGTRTDLSDFDKINALRVFQESSSQNLV